MSKFTALISKFAREDEGAALLEYTILLALITAAVVGSITALGTGLNTKWEAVCTAIAIPC